MVGRGWGPTFWHLTNQRHLSLASILSDLLLALFRAIPGRFFDANVLLSSFKKQNWVISLKTTQIRFYMHFLLSPSNTVNCSLRNKITPKFLKNWTLQIYSVRRWCPNVLHVFLLAWREFSLKLWKACTNDDVYSCTERRYQHYYVKKDVLDKKTT